MAGRDKRLTSPKCSVRKAGEKGIASGAPQAVWWSQDREGIGEGLEIDIWESSARKAGRRWDGP